MPNRSDEEFPGFARCMDMMRKRKTMTAEDGYFWLLPRAGAFVKQLLAELEYESDVGVQIYILELLGAACDVRALPVFLQYLSNPNEWLCMWAENGLRGLKRTSEGRRALWALYWRQTPLPTTLTEDEEQSVHEILEGILHAPSCAK